MVVNLGEKAIDWLIIRLTVWTSKPEFGIDHTNDVCWYAVYTNIQTINQDFISLYTGLALYYNQFILLYVLLLIIKIN